jgi:F-box protein 25/32
MENETEIPPHCHITLKCTREIAGFNGLGEAVQRLDFRSSVRDRRRFHYICALLRLIVSGKGITNLPGGAQRLLLQMLEEVATHVSDSQQNINVLRGLVLQLRNLLNQENQKCWGKPLGSQSLWDNHVQTIQRIQDIASQIQIKEVRRMSLHFTCMGINIVFTFIYSPVPVYDQNFTICQKNAFVK